MRAFQICPGIIFPIDVVKVAIFEISIIFFNEYFYFIDMYYPDIDYSDIFLKYFHCLDIYVLEKFAQYNKNQRIIDAIIDHIQTEEYGLSEEDIDEDLIYCLNQNKLAFPFLIKNQKYIK